MISYTCYLFNYYSVAVVTNLNTTSSTKLEIKNELQ